MKKILPKLTDLIKDTKCTFSMLRAGYVYYTISYTDWGENKIKKRIFLFTIPIDDLGGATINSTEKSITLMRWIRKAYANQELVEVTK